MLTLSKEMLLALQDHNDITYTVEITLSGHNAVDITLTEDDLAMGGCQIVRSNSSDTFPLGYVYCSQLTLNIIRTTELEWIDYFNATAVVKGVYEYGETQYAFDLGTYILTDPTTQGEIITLIGYDGVFIADIPVSDNYRNMFPMTAIRAFKEACNYCGINFNHEYSYQGFPSAPSNWDDCSVTISTLPDGTTYRQVMGAVALLFGANAYISPFDNHMYVVPIKSQESQVMYWGGYFDGATPYASGDNLAGGTFNPWTTGDIVSEAFGSDADVINLDDPINHPTFPLQDITINGVKSSEGDYTYGSGYLLTVDISLYETGKQEIINRIGAAVVGFTFRPFELDYKSFPFADLYQRVIFADSRSRVYGSLLTHLDITLKGVTVFKCTAENPARNDMAFISAATRAMDAAKKAREAAALAEAANEEATRAKNTANQASSTASQASSDASAAASAASQAQTTANQANSTAQAASTTASQANTTANAASTTASQASTDAAAASAAAAQASTDASQAKTTANAANTTATQASATASQASADVSSARTEAAAASAAAAQASADASQASSDASQARQDASTALSTVNNAIDAVGLEMMRLNTLMANAMGVFETKETNQSTGAITYYLHNKQTLASSDTIWKMTAEGFAVSNDGGTTWAAGIDAQGHAVVNVLSAIGIYADWIKSGRITSDNERSYWDLINGAFSTSQTPQATTWYRIGRVIHDKGRSTYTHLFRDDWYGIPPTEIVIGHIGSSYYSVPNASVQNTYRYMMAVLGKNIVFSTEYSDDSLALDTDDYAFYINSDDTGVTAPYGLTYTLLFLKSAYFRSGATFSGNVDAPHINSTDVTCDILAINDSENNAQRRMYILTKTLQQSTNYIYAKVFAAWRSVFIFAPEDGDIDYESFSNINGNLIYIIGDVRANGVMKATSFQNTSDERYKDIEEWDDRYDQLIDRIEPIRFRWKNSKEKTRHIGVSAQKVKAALEDLGITDSGIVGGSEESSYLVAYNELTTLLIGKVKRQQKKIDELEERISRLEKLMEDANGSHTA